MNNVFSINIPLSAHLVLPLYSQNGSNEVSAWCDTPKNYCFPLQTQRNNIIQYTGVDTLATLRAISWYAGGYPDAYSTRINTLILSTICNGQSFVFDSDSVATDNNSTIIKPDFLATGRWMAVND